MSNVFSETHLKKGADENITKTSVEIGDFDNCAVNSNAVSFKFNQFSPGTDLKVGRNKYKISRCWVPLNRTRFQHCGLQKKTISLQHNSSFECNQSLPSVSKKRNELVRNNSHGSLSRLSTTMDKIRVDGPNGIRFSARKSRGCFTPDSSSLFGNSGPQATDSIRISQASINPNKAVFTIDAKTTDILIVNSNACSLLGYSSKELCEMKLLTLLHNKNRNPASALAEGQFNSEDGSMVLLSGKVVEMIRKNGTPVPVSLWIRQLEQEGPCVAVAEPVQRRVAQLMVDKRGVIKSADAEAVLIFQCGTDDQLCGMDITNIIPSIVLPESDISTISKNVKKQKATGRTLDGFTFPLCLILNLIEDVDTGDNELKTDLYSISVWVFSNLSGLVVMNDNGIIECVNHHFTMLLFGHPQDKVIGEKITHIIPNFCEDFEYIEFSHSRHMTISSVGNSDTETDSLHLSNKFISSLQKHKMAADNTSMQNNANISNLSIEFTVPRSFGEAQFKRNCDQKDSTNYGGETSRSESNIEADITKDVEESLKALSFEAKSSKEYVMVEKNNLHLALNNMKSIEEELLTPVNNGSSKLNNDIENNLNISNLSVSQEHKECEISFESDETMFKKKSNFHINLISCEDDDELQTPINEVNLGQVNGDRIELKEDTDLLTCRGAVNNGSTDQLHINSDTVTPIFKRCKELIDKRQHMSTSTPELKERILPKTVYREGRYKGLGLHADGNSLDIQYIVLKQSIPFNRNVFCVWVSFDPQELLNQDYTLTSSFNSTVEHSLGQAIKQTAAQNQSRPNSVSLMSQCEEEQVKGEYNQNYTTLRQIGKGAYGYVKMAYRNSDRLLVISKFILKERVNDEFWVWDKEMGRNVPLEISLLSTLNHPNIVRVYDIYENDKFFQLIMEKHGSGMDLFEFIDRMPMLDEPLISYIFRQIASAVEYLHSLQILHRDIKDENVIIDHKFDVKLIDFGSATFFKPDSEFSTFYGTTEYCSPEVLAGNKYSGPELEIWSMGVTLFVLTFCVNPFEDIEETLRGILLLPCKVSQGLEQLLFSMLSKDPTKRCTMSELMASQWLHQPVDITKYDFAQVVSCDLHEVQPEQYYTVEGYSIHTCPSSGVVTPQETGFISENNSIPTSGFSQTDLGKIQIDSKENTDDNIDVINFKLENVEVDEMNHSVDHLPDSLGNLDTFDYDYDSWDEEDSFS